MLLRFLLQGGGVRIQNCAVTFNDCIFFYNVASGHSGHGGNFVSALLEPCEFPHPNRPPSFWQGGAVFSCCGGQLLDFQNCNLYENEGATVRTAPRSPFKAPNISWN